MLIGVKKDLKEKFQNLFSKKSIGSDVLKIGIKKNDDQKEIFDIEVD